MKKAIYLILIVGLLLIRTGSAQAIVVTQTTDLSALGSSLGGGITVTGISGYVNQFGTYTNASGNLGGIGSGIIMSNGEVLDYGDGPNTVGNKTYKYFGAGDSDLTTLIGGTATNDAAVMNLSFTALGAGFYFDFVFGSEEYQAAGDTYPPYNDVFGAFWSGAGGPNIAFDESSNIIAAQVVNFTNFTTGTELDAATSILTASYAGLTPGNIYYLKLGIADAIDRSADSTVYLSNFTHTGIPEDDHPVIPEPASLSLLGLGLLGLMGLRRRI